MPRTCKLCKSKFSGRSDKIFCSHKCRSRYRTLLHQATGEVTKNIDGILHRNRSILLEIMGKNLIQKKVPREELDRKGFNFSYLTNYHINVNRKFVSYVYDFSWMIFSDQEVLIRRIRK